MHNHANEMHVWRHMHRRRHRNILLQRTVHDDRYIDWDTKTYSQNVHVHYNATHCWLGHRKGIQHAETYPKCSLLQQYTIVLRPFFPGLPGWAGARRNLPLDVMVQGKITEADTPTIWLDATPLGLISDLPPSCPNFYAGCPSCHNPPTLSWLGTGTKYAGLHTQWRGFLF